MKRFVLALLCLITFVVTPVSADPIAVTTTSVALNPEDLSQDRIGKLKFRGGLHLQSDTSDRLGGLSALGLSEDGKRMVALSDEGARFDARLIYDEKGNLAGLSDTEIFRMTAPNGEIIEGKDAADIESMAPGVGGEMIVAFEQVHRVWMYTPSGTNPQPLATPSELEGQVHNKGIEALTLLQDGSLLALSEGFGRGNASIGWVSSARGWDPLIYQIEDSYLPTGATTLPNGDALVLERFFTPRSGSRIRVRRVDGSTIEAGATLTGELLGELRAPLTVDNFEGIETVQGPKGETLVYLVSDDNFQRFGEQRTLLLMFELTD